MREPGYALGAVAVSPAVHTVDVPKKYPIGALIRNVTLLNFRDEQCVGRLDNFLFTRIRLAVRSTACSRTPHQPLVTVYR